jgi:hypothetical protein
VEAESQRSAASAVHLEASDGKVRTMAISADLIELLDKLDLETMTIAEVREIRNPVLRRVLFDAILKIAAGPQHTSHGSHTSHLKSQELEIQFGTPISPSP